MSIPSLYEIKGLAHAERKRAALAGENLSHSQALERVSKSLGYRDWNACQTAATAADHERQQERRATTDVGRSLHGTSNVFWFDDIEAELPETSVGLYYGHPQRKVIVTLVKSARQLETIAENGQDHTYRALLGLLSDPYPYVFERNVGRWSDRKYHLVARSYKEIGDVALSLEEMVELGAKHWYETEFKAPMPAGHVTVIDDDIKIEPSYERKR